MLLLTMALFLSSGAALHHSLMALLTTTISSVSTSPPSNTHLYIDHVYRKIAELATLLAGSDIPKSPLGYVRLQTLQSYDGRDVPGNFNPTTQTVVATNKFSVLSKGNLRPMSKDVLETILILDFKAQGRGRRFQYATYGPPAPEGGRTIKEYAVRLAPATQAAAGHEGSAPPATLVPPQYGANFCSSMLEPLKRYGINPKTRSRDGFAVKLQPLVPYVGHRLIPSSWSISSVHGAPTRPTQPTYFSTPVPTVREDILNVQADGRLAAHLHETPAPHILKEDAEPTVGHHFFETMCPTAFLAPTLIAKTCFICTQPKHAFFLAQLALQGHRANGKKPLPGRVPGPKKGTKMVPKSGSFQKEFFCSVAKKKSQKLDRALP